MSEEKTPEGKRHRSARARFESFQRQDDAGKGRRRVITVLCIGLFLAVLGLLWFERQARIENGWFEAYKNAAFFARTKEWSELEDLIAKDAVIECPGVSTRADLLALAKAYSSSTKGTPVFTTHPHDFGELGEDRRFLRFFLIWGRGGFKESGLSIPIVKDWLVHAEFELDEKKWRVVKLIVKPTLHADGGPEVKDPSEDR